MADAPRSCASRDESAPDLISKRIAGLGDWRGKSLRRIRSLIREADPLVVEEWKWARTTSPGTPVWSHDGIICTGETYKNVVKLTFARGASLEDPTPLFNASLDGNVRRAIDIREGEDIDASAFKALVRQAVALNKATSRNRTDRTPSKKPRKSAAEATTRRVASGAAKARKSAGSSPSRTPARPKLLSGGNPQIAKADGDAPVQAYIAAMPGWKRDVGRRLDALIVRTVPGVRKAVRWNSPFYGLEGRGWFLAFHCFTNYVKVTWFRGASLRPVPPGESRDENVRYLDIREDERLDEKLVTRWIRQASKLPGWIP